MLLRLSFLRSRRKCRIGTDSHKALLFQMQNYFLSCFFRAQLRGIDHDLGIRRRFVRVGDTSELLYDSRAGLGIQTLAITLFTGFDRSGNVHQDEPSVGFNHLSYLATHRVVWSNGSANRNATVFRDLRRNVTNAANVDIAMLFGKSEL